MLVAGLCVWGIIESCYGLSQALGWRSSRHALYALTGHFQNPGPFGGFIACVMAVAGAWLLRHSKDHPAGPIIYSVVNWTTTALAWVALAAGLLVLPASMSRAGWLGLAIALGIEWLRVQPDRQGPGGAFARAGSGAAERSPIAAPGPLPSGKRTKPQRMVIVLSVGLVLLAGAFALKPDSALGRLHVWRMECRAIVARPWRGAGPGLGPWAYGEAQEAFFREHLATASPATVRVAGCPEYAFNEFLGLGVEYGLPALQLSILLVVSSILVLHRSNSPLAAGLTAWAVFACASYPLSVPQLRILGTIFIICAVLAGALQAAGSAAPKTSLRSSLPRLPAWAPPAYEAAGGHGFRGGTACRLFAGLLPVISVVLLAGWLRLPWLYAAPGLPNREQFRELYAEGYALHQAGEYEESTRVLEEGALLSCDPMFEIILGKNAEAMGNYAEAARLYEKAHYMVPSRLYPLVRLMRLQVRLGEDDAALETARVIVSMPVNDRNAGMVRLRAETQATLDSLSAQRCDPAVNHNELTDSDIQNNPRKRLPGSL